MYSDLIAHVYVVACYRKVPVGIAEQHVPEEEEEESADDAGDDAGDDELDGLHKGDTDDLDTQFDLHDDLHDDIPRSTGSSPDSLIQFTAGPEEEEEGFYQGEEEPAATGDGGIKDSVVCGEGEGEGGRQKDRVHWTYAWLWSDV